MIIAHLIGGLGNQMFQYALGRHLAYLNNTELKLDVRQLNRHKHRNYELHFFNIKEAFATSRELIPFQFSRFKQLFTTSTSRFYRKEKTKFLCDQSLLELRGDIYLAGSWQSDKYFTGIEKTIRQDFSFKHPLSNNLQPLVHSIQSTDSVAVHVRRGDYVTNKHTNSVHGLCEIDYYQKCADLIMPQLSNSHFFIFSDDPIWCKENLKFNGPTTFVEPHQGHEDLHLMSLSKHFIIANSSFSWWGAWLSNNRHKQVYAPKNWLNIEVFKKIGSVDENLIDLIPDSWMRVC